jgi:membrane protein
MEMKQQIKKTRIWKKIAFFLVVELLFFYLVQLIVPSCNVLVEKLDGHYVGYVNDRTGYQTIRFSDEGKGTVQSTLYHIDKEVELDLAREKAKSDVPVTVLNLERLHPYTYQGMYDIVIHNALLKQSAVFALFNLALIVLTLLAKKKQFSLADFASCFFYRSEKQEPWRKKQWLILLAVLLLSFIIAPGVDLPSITRMSSNFISGGDIYQIQNLREMEVYSLEFNSYPYNPIMLLFYSLPDILSFGFAPFYLQTYVLWLPAAIFKLCNALLMREVILSLEGYMLDCGLLSENQKRRSFWFVFCTPVIFYVAISYIQLDVLPMYFITEGLLQLLRLDEKKVNRAVGAVLMAMGCLCKLQNLLLAPACFLVLFVLIWQKKRELFNAVVYLCTLIFCMSNIYVWNPVIGIFLSQNQQSKRIWFTAFPYVVDAAFLYLTIFFVVLFFALASLQFRSTLRKEQLLFGALLINSSLVLLFSATILDTLSTYIISFPAFVYTLYQERDDMKSFMIWAFSILILTQWIFGNVGDVTSALHYLGRTGIFSKIEQELAGTPEGIRLSSTLFTLTKAGLTLYAIMFYGELKKICSNFSEKPVENKI